MVPSARQIFTPTLADMKKILPILLLIVAACAGCVTRYSLVLTNGDIITAQGKPTYDAQKGRYYYTDANGQPASVFASKVREISPANMVDKGGTQFLK